MIRREVTIVEQIGMALATGAILLVALIGLFIISWSS